MTATREVVITYGSFASNASGWKLHGAHSIQQDERRFVCSYDVVYRGSGAASVANAVASMEAALNARHQSFAISIDGTTYTSFIASNALIAGGGISGSETAEFIRADFQLLGTHRTKFSRAYRITVTVTRAANQTDKPGLLDQRINVTTNALGFRRLAYRAVFTVGPNDSETGTALDRYADGDYGFAARVTAIQTALGGTWERVGPISQVYDEDERSLIASAEYQELKFAQSASGTNDAKLVSIQYDVQVVRGSAYGVPEFNNVGAMSSVTVFFSSGVDYNQETDLDAVIDDVVVPYCASTLATYLSLNTSPITMSHTLRADPVNHRISGQIYYIVDETQVLEASRRLSDVARKGDRLIPLLDGTQWNRHLHTGPGFWIRRSVLAVRVVGREWDAAAVLGIMESQDRETQKGEGFHFTGWSVNTSPSVEVFAYGGETLTTTVQMRILEYERADIVNQGTGGLGAFVGGGGADEFNPGGGSPVGGSFEGGTTEGAGGAAGVSPVGHEERS